MPLPRPGGIGRGSASRWLPGTGEWDSAGQPVTLGGVSGWPLAVLLFADEPGGFQRGISQGQEPPVAESR
jgi:hypothetical protein